MHRNMIDCNETSKSNGEEKLNVFQITMVGIGGIIGAGFFLASSITIKAAGPAVVLDYLLGAFIMSQVFSALAEMLVANPVSGSFQVYADTALGSYGGFLIGWMYWISGVVVMSSEVTAAAVFTSYWFPNIPLWIFTALYSAIIYIINYSGVKDFTVIETWFSSIKVIALAVLIIIGVWILALYSNKHGIGIENYISYGGFMPNGIKGFMDALLLSAISYGDAIVTALTAAKAQKPSRDVPRAIRNIVIALTVLYVGSMLLLLAIVPWQQVKTSSSPFVRLFKYLNIPYAASITNFVLLSATLTIMNAAMYAVTEDLVTLGKGRYAPTIFTRKNRRGSPVLALSASSAGLFIAVIVAYLLPKNVYEYITSTAAFMVFFNWILIILTHIKYRPIVLQQNPKCLKYKMWGYPYTSWITLILLIIVLLSSLFSRIHTISLMIGISIIIALTLFYWTAIKTGLFDRW